jgi:uncharacterized protein DUF1707
MAQHGSDPDRPPVRASDGDRQRVADLLRQHTSEGRLTIEEYEQRVDAAYGARTIAELRPLLADLPVRLDEVLPWTPVTVPAVPQRDNSERFMRYVLAMAAIVVVVAGLLAATRGFIAFWPLLLIGIFVFGGRGGSAGGRGCGSRDSGGHAK